VNFNTHELEDIINIMKLSTHENYKYSNTFE